MIFGAIGVVALLVKRSARAGFIAIFILALPPAFYIWSMHSSGTPIFVPTLWPFSCYNTRYAIAVLPLAAFAAGALVTLVPARARFTAALLLGALPGAVWMVQHDPAVCWKESEVNSDLAPSLDYRGRSIPRHELSPGIRNHLWIRRFDWRVCAKPAFRCANRFTKATSQSGCRPLRGRIWLFARNGRWRLQETKSQRRCSARVATARTTNCGSRLS